MLSSAGVSFTLPLDSPPAALALVGGKAVNLMRMQQAGLPVPDGFVINTHAYRAFVESNGLAEEIDRALASLVEEDAAGLERASEHIRGAFARGTLAPPLVQQILACWQTLGSGAVAVRSSATVEDLPEMSFAGQQDTFLHVLGENDLLASIVGCWSSLWTARAIGYRRRNGVEHSGAALAVVVQMMVPSDVSGVLFTANPLSGLRSEIVIDAALGLGEALVSGQVEPDHYVVDAAQHKIVQKTLGAKAISIRGRSGGGTQTVPESAAHMQALPDEQIFALAALGQRVASLYAGAPQDIEWAYAAGSFFLLQTRAITSLFPVPAELPADPPQVLLSFGAVQGMLDPITPIGRDVVGMLMAAGAGLVLRKQLTLESQHVLYSAGERLWINITPIVRNSVGRKAVGVGLGLVEPSARQAIAQVWNDPRLLPERSGIRFRTMLLLARFFGRLGLNVLRNILRPEARGNKIRQDGEDALAALRAQAQAIHGDLLEKLRQRVEVLPAFIAADLSRIFIQFVSAVAAGMASLNQINQQARDLSAEKLSGGAWHPLVLAMTRGVPNNPTTQMDLALWQMARKIQSDPKSAAAFVERTAPELAQAYRAGDLPEVLQQELNAFLEQYGARGLAEIDTGRSRWTEDPTHVLESLAGYLQIRDQTRAPDVVFQRGMVEALAAQRHLEQMALRERFGWLRRMRIRFFAHRMRALVGLREAPKFFAVRALAIYRNGLLESGSDLVGQGVLRQPEDIFFLSLADLRALASDEQRDWQKIVDLHRDRYNREKLRRQVPRLLVSDGRAFYEGMAAADGSDAAQLTGSPVSPGTAEGSVRVVLDPRQAGLLPGEILVCPGTDPSWTPLFLIAGGLVMEVGGMMTHGAVVAREYGIPAIVGVDQATRRLQTGQQIRIDGSTGRIQLL